MPSNRRRLILAAVAAMMVAACTPAGPSAKVTEARFRPPLGTSDIGVAYFTIRSTQPDRILGVKSPRARAIEMHGTMTQDGMSSMKRQESVELPAGEAVSFAPGGLHLMVFSPETVAEDAGQGATFPITIELESGAKLEIPFDVLAAGDSGRH